MSALPIEQPVHRPDGYTCSGPEGPCDPAMCGACGATVCADTRHWVDEDAAALCFAEDYWHGRVVHRDCHLNCTARECNEPDEDVLGAYNER